MPSVSKTSGLPKACGRCGAPAKKVCTRCEVARYCTADCQLADWKAGHRATCRKAARDVGSGGAARGGQGGGGGADRGEAAAAAGGAGVCVAELD